jgi:spermidine synthase
MIYERESRYNYIQVLQVADYRYLMLNEGQGVHSVYNPHTLDTFGTWDMFVAAPFFNSPGQTQVHRMCVIGLAAGTVARQATAAFGPIPIDGVEIDPAIVDVGQALFDMDMPNLNVFVIDGRFFLQHTSAVYDLIVVDAYRLPYIPFQLTTTEFFALARAHLTPNGVVTVNVGRTDTDYRMVTAIASTLSQHFATIHVIDIPDTFNTVLVATLQQTTAANLTSNLVQVEDPFLHELLARAVLNVRATRAHYAFPDTGVIFTDDRAPVESLTNAILIHFLLSGE